MRTMSSTYRCFMSLSAIDTTGSMRVTAPLESPSRVERCPYLDELPWTKSRNTRDSDGTGLVLFRSARVELNGSQYNVVA